MASGRTLERSPILVVVQSPVLLARPELNESFRGDDTLLLVRCPQGDPRTYTSTMHLPCVYITAPGHLIKINETVSSNHAPEREPLLLVIGPKAGKEEIKQFILAGASGYLSDDATIADIKSAIRAVVRGEYWVGRMVLSEIVRELITVPALSPLTGREMEVLKLLPGGYTNREIADLLGITYETVRWHLRSIYAKMGVKDRTGAIACAKQIRGSKSQSVPRRSAGPSE